MYKSQQIEIEVAAKLQHMLFPKNQVFDGFVSIQGFYLPHKSVGGDFYDFFQITKNEIVMMVGDVTGKGIAAGLTVSYLMAIIKSELSKTKSLKTVVYNANRLFYDTFKGEIFCTFLIARYNFINRELQYINCGHHCPVLIRNSKLSKLNVASEMMGLNTEMNAIRKMMVRLQKHDQLLFYTDGLIESENEVITENEFVSHLHENYDENIYQTLIHRTKEMTLNDDVTIINLNILQ